MIREFFQDPVPDMATARDRVRAGAFYLDGLYGNEWARKINVSRLSIRSPIHCILGQLIRQWHFESVFLPLVDRGEYGFSCGLWDACFFLPPPWVRRSFDRLTLAWKKLIKDRLTPQTKPVVLKQRRSDRDDHGRNSFSSVC